MLIKLHGRFSDDYQDFEIEADTVAEAIEGWSRQVGFYEHLLVDERPIARVIGFDTIEKLNEKTEQTVIHVVPAMLGGGGKFGQILIGAALIGLSFTGLGTVVSTALLGAGIGMALGGVMGLFMKAPTVSGSNDPEASKYLGLSDNTTTIGTPIAFCLGEVPINGHVLALNIDSSDMITGAFPSVPA